MLTNGSGAESFCCDSVRRQDHESQVNHSGSLTVRMNSRGRQSEQLSAAQGEPPAGAS